MLPSLPNRCQRTLNVETTAIPGLLLIQPKVFRDPRGFFLETFQRQRYRDAGLVADFVQDNYSRSSKGILRGLHYQVQHPQGKLVPVLSGKVFDVVVDLRKNSPAFGRWLGFRGGFFLRCGRHGKENGSVET